MSKWVLKYNRNKKQFNLNIGGRHFIYRKSRAEEVEEIDNWLINNEPVENNAYITFEDCQGKLHKNIAIDTNRMQLWYYDDKQGNPDWKRFVWYIPTSEGNIWLHERGGHVTYGDKYKNSLVVRPDKVVIKLIK